MGVILIGEFMFDVLIDWRHGKAWLISGAAGTVARAVRANGVEVRCVGWVKRNPVSLVMAKMVGLSTRDIWSDSAAHGCLRVRFHWQSRNEPVLKRLDVVGNEFGPQVVRAWLLESLAMADRDDVLVISDFGKTDSAVQNWGPEIERCKYKVALVGSKGSLYSGLPRSVLVTSIVDRALVANTVEDLELHASRLAAVRDGTVILTGGSLGVAYAGSFGVGAIRTQPVMKAFSVGAGDWLLGCLVAKVDNGLGMLAALSLAVEAATKSVGEVWVGASCEQL